MNIQLFANGSGDSELITKKSELYTVTKGLDNHPATYGLKKMIKMLTDDDNRDKAWEKFAKHFDKLKYYGLETHRLKPGLKVHLVASPFLFF